MTGVSRENKKYENTFRNEVWGYLPGLINCLWYTAGGTGDLKEQVLEYSKSIRAGLEKMEKELQEVIPHIQQNKCHLICKSGCDCLPDSKGHDGEYVWIPCKNPTCEVCHTTPTQPEWMKGLREEFKKHFWGKFSETGFEAEHVNKMVDWWLSNFSTTIQKEIERERLSIVEECEKLRIEGDHSGNSVVTSIQEFIQNK
jgi:hypothetical protein